MRIFGLIGKVNGTWHVISPFNEDLQAKLDKYYQLVGTNGKAKMKLRTHPAAKEEEVQISELWIADSRRPYKVRKF